MAEAVNLGTIYSLAELRLGEWNRGFATITRDAAAFKSLKMAQVPTLDASKFGASMNALKASTTSTLSSIKTQFATHNAQTLAAAQSHAKAISRAAEDEKVGVLRAARSRIAEEKTLTTSAKLTIIHEAQDRARQISRAAADEKAAVLLQAKETTAGLKLQFAQQTAAAVAAAKEQEKAQKKAFEDQQQKRQKQGEAFQKVKTGVGVGAAAIPSAVATGAIWSAEQAAEFEKTMVMAQNNTDMTTRGAAIMRETAARNLTQYGVPAEQTARAFRLAGDYGFTDEKATTIVDAAIKSSVGTGTDVGDMTAIVAGTMKNFNIPLDEAGKLSSKIHQAAIKGRMTPGEFVHAAGPSLGVAAGLGMKDPDEIFAMFSALTQAQLTPEEANTQIRNVLFGISKPHPLQERKLKAISGLTGIPLDKDFTQAGLLQKGPMAIIDDLRRATAGGNESDIFDLMNAAKGGGAGALFLTKKMGPLAELRKDFKLIDQGKMDPTAAGFERQQATMDAAMQRLGGEFTMIGVKIGTDLLPALKGFTGWLDGLLHWFSNLPAPVRKMMEAGAGVAAGGGAGVAMAASPGGQYVVGAPFVPNTVTGGSLATLAATFLGKNFGYNLMTQLPMGGMLGAMPGGAGDRYSTDASAGDSSGGLRSDLTRRGFISRGYRTGLATTFGFNDPMDSGYGRWGDRTNNTTLNGVALPREVLAGLFGPGGAGDKNWHGRMIEVVNTLTGAVAKLPIVDIGPGKGPQSRGVVIDLTEGAKRLLGANGLTPIAYRVPGAGAGAPSPEAGPPRLYTRAQYEAATHGGKDKGAKTDQQIADEMIGIGGDQYDKDVSAAVKAFHAKIAAHGDYGKAMQEMNARLDEAKQKDDARFDKALTALIDKGAKERDALNKAAAQKEIQYAKDVYAAWEATQKMRWGAAMAAQKDITEGEFGPGLSLHERETLTREMQESMAKANVERFGDEEELGPGLSFQEKKKQREEMWRAGERGTNAITGGEEYGPGLSERTKQKQASETARAFKAEWGSTMKTVEGGFEHFAAAAFKHIHSVGSLWSEFVKSMREVFINAVAQMAAKWATAAIFGGDKGPLGTLGGGKGGGGLLSGLGSIGGVLGGLFGGGRKGAGVGDMMGPQRPGAAGGGGAGGLGGLSSLLHLGGGALGGLGAAMPWIGGGLVLNQLMGDPLGKVFKGVKKLFHFDDPINDRSAQKWGFDFASHFAKGAESHWDRREAFGGGRGGNGDTTNGGHTFNQHFHGDIHGVQGVEATFKDAAYLTLQNLSVVTPGR